MRRNWFHVMAALAREDAHGSGIERDVLDQTGGQLRLWPATLYRTLEELATEGLIEELAGEAHPDGVSERRRYYRLTAAGRLVLSAEADRLASLAGMAKARLRGG